MQLSDLTQGVRRVRALFTQDEVNQLLTNHVAAEAGIDRSSKTVTSWVVVHPAHSPLCCAAEVIIEVSVKS